MSRMTPRPFRDRRRPRPRRTSRPPGLAGIAALTLLALFVLLWWSRYEAARRLPAQGNLPQPPPAETTLVDRVERVIDGDTIVGARLGRIRYIGINTPELDAPDPAVRRMAQEAARVNRRLVEGRTVQLALDVQERDRYGRLLAYVWVEGLFVNAHLVEQGYAQAMTVPPNVRYAELFVRLEREARANRRGFWGRQPDWTPADR